MWWVVKCHLLGIIVTVANYYHTTMNESFTVRFTKRGADFSHPCGMNESLPPADISYQGM